jgi:DNA polymerase III subunit delta'
MSAQEQLIGQTLLKACLDRAVFSSSGQAFLFVGPHGIGKHTFGHAFARGILCNNPLDFSGCENCISCEYMDHQTHPDYREILLEDGDKTIKTSKVRSILCNDVHIMPQISNKKVYFLDADYLNEQSQNAILKTLEELPEYAVIILSVSHRQILLPTLLSRVVPMVFARNTATEISVILSDHHAGKTIDSEFIAGISEGIPGYAKELSDNEDLIGLRKEVLRRMFCLHKSSRTEILTEFYAFVDDHKSQIDLIFAIIFSWIRDMMICLENPSSDRFINSLVLENCEDCRASKIYSADALSQITHIVANAARALKQNSGFENSICNMLLQIRKELNNA